jgi:hypothetical protein
VTEEEEWNAVRAALREAGVDAADLARFVNAPNPAIPGLEPSTFDSGRAHSVLLKWLPRVHAKAVVDTLASRIRESGRASESAQVLIAKYRDSPSWQLGDAIARTMTPAEHDDVVRLCADPSAGQERQMLVYALWRIKTDAARALIRDLVRDPSVANHAMYSARRAFGNEEAARLIEPLCDDPDIADAAHHALKRIDRSGR